MVTLHEAYIPIDVKNIKAIVKEEKATLKLRILTYEGLPVYS